MEKSDLLKDLGNSLRPEPTLKEKIQKLDRKKFYPIGADCCNLIDLQADGKDETYMIYNIPYSELDEKFYEEDTPDHIVEYREWQYESSFIKEYMLNHIGDVQIIKE